MLVCPSCESYLMEGEVIKFNAVYSGNTPVSYDARCPRCSTDMGKVLWGRLEPAQQQEESRPPKTPEPKEEGDSGGERTAQTAEERRCPHCGKSLPDDI